MKKISVFIGSVFVGAGLCLASCAMPVPDAQLPELTFENLDRLHLQANMIDVIDRAKQADGVSQNFPNLKNPPRQTVKKLLERRFTPTPFTAHQVNFSIMQADLTRLANKGDEEGYRVDLGVTIEVFDNFGSVKNASQISIFYESFFSEELSLADKDKMRFRAIEKAMQKLDAAIIEKLGQFNMLAP